MLDRPPRHDHQRAARFHIAHCPLRHLARAQRWPDGRARQFRRRASKLQFQNDLGLPHGPGDPGSGGFKVR